MVVARSVGGDGGSRRAHGGCACGAARVLPVAVCVAWHGRMVQQMSWAVLWAQARQASHGVRPGVVVAIVVALALGV